MTHSELKSSLLDYLQALHASTNGNVLRIPTALWRLGLSRVAYKLGPRPYSLFRLWLKDRSSWKEYLDDSPLKPLMRTLSSERDREIIVDKILFYSACKKHELPTAPIVGIFKSAASTHDNSGLPYILDSTQLESILSAHKDGLFCKPYDGTHGIGAFAIIPRTNGWQFPLGIGNSQAIFKYCTECAVQNNLLVQPRLTNAPRLQQLMAEGGLGTIRVVTYMDSGEPKLLAACLRLITAGNAADNFGHGSTGNFVASIDLSTGRLIALRASRSKKWPLIYDADRHPENSVPVAGFELPYWTDCVRLALRSQVAFRQLHSVGWDIGITENGPILIEGNAQYDFDLLQVAHDRGFRPELQRVIASHKKQDRDRFGL